MQVTGTSSHLVSAHLGGAEEEELVLGMPVGGFPVLVGASRKSFIGHILGDANAAV